MKHLIFALALPLSFTACDGGEVVADDSGAEAATFGLTFSGSGYEANEGQTIRTLVLEDGTLAEHGAGEAVVTAGAFAFDYGATAITEGEGYSIFWYIDTDADATCTGGTDVTGFFWFGDVSAAVDVPVTPGAPNEPTDASCDVF